MIRFSPRRAGVCSALAAVCLAVGLAGVAPAPVGAVEATAPTTVGDAVIGWVEVEDGAISGAAAGPPGFNSGDHGNFSGAGSYTFRETGMTSTMSVTAPAAGVYPVYVRYAAGPLGAEENVTRSMGLLTNGGARQLMSLPMTSFENWEAWRFVHYDVTLQQGANTISIQCDRATDFCRLNFDAIQVGGTAPDPCVATAPTPGYASLYDGTFASFEGWRKAGVGGFGRQTDCTIRSLRGRGATWFTQQQAAPYTLELDWKRISSNDDSSVYLASSGRGGADAVGGYTIPIGADTGAIVPTGGTLQAANPTALAAALHPVGQWNTYRVQLTGARLELYLNGTLINSMNRPAGAAVSGFVGLENRSLTDRVHYRKIQMRPDVELGRLAAPFTRATLADGTTINPGGESALGNLVAESQRWATRAAGSGAAQIAFVAPDALGADLLGTAGGYPATVTYQQAALVQPSARTLINLKLTGAQLKTVLEQQWQRTADGTVPARPFLSLGTSAGFTYTHDPTQVEGSRITGIWLNDVAIAPASSYSVTASSVLASGGDNFRAFAAGTSRQDTGTTGLAALTDYVGTVAGPTVGGTPLALNLAQHSVGVAFPGGAPSSYVVGGPLDIDLTSLANSALSDRQDTSVQVTLDGRSLGSFAVETTTGTDPYDEYGAAAVRATIPSDTAAGPAVVVIVGNRSGTTVRLPITVRLQADSTTSLIVTPATVPVRRGNASVSVTVASTGSTPVGDVKIYVNGTSIATATLVDGSAKVRVGPFSTVGNRTIEARFLGSATTKPSKSQTATVRVDKAIPKLTVKTQPSRITANRTRATMVIAVAAQGLTPTGKVTVKIGRKTYAGSLTNGKATIKLTRFKKAGTVRASVTYVGDARTKSVSTTARITVKKAART
ncbi:5'-nucleotidase C-terminal domain-containing protein [Aeromicrobium sp.]|uniref:5'-nucleotidase C-terminal domain-containing protein n=1 Tax=Aeromicrobium sp. TaxID=1871063 RepID=UPI0019903AFB|nr:5'-nucleotidase C-terminal domain-containing protein [Aeromicrobium sp.]MBC7632521.1 5'-nucleotidase C-terminal domain-containing protein [Aeromicrobium sp.]